MTDYTIPRANAPIAGQEAPTTQWYNFLRYLDSRTSSNPTDVQAEIDTIAIKLGSPDGTVANIPPFKNITSFDGVDSVSVTGDTILQFRLVNDAATVAPIYYYGTDSAGKKGYNLLYSAFAATANIAKANTSGIVSFDLTDLADSGAGVLLATTFDVKGRKTGSRAATITGTAGRVTVVNGDASAGLPTIDLATVTDAGGGTLQKTAFDAYGRKTGTSAATTSDLAEGSNLYFTNARVLATILTGLSTATATPVTATDSVLIGIGKLQGQASANATAIAGKEPSITAGTTAQYWRGDKTWRDFATDVRAAVLTGLSLATSAVISATDTVLGALGKLQAQITANLLPPGYIDGLKMVWVSGTALTVSSGAAYIPSLGNVERAASDIAKTGLSLTASAWYHVYLFDNSGTPSVEVVTTAPSATYNGTARTKTGDTSRRYVGSVKTDASSNIIRFDHSPQDGNVMYLMNINNAPLHALTGGTATSATNIDLSGALPPTSRRAMIYGENSAPALGPIAYFSTPDLGDPITNVLTFIRATFKSPTTVVTTAAQLINYEFNGAPSSGGLDVWIVGYGYER